uniref:Uncharacterized protein n=1 Tax=Tanacetum cinerariifolium TaxID=118510 RepID=A0A6L2KFF0_TANCI|nr:hypothetical protein [Tanacetum cinerariifolium]
MATVEERVQTLVEDGKYVQDVLDVVDTKIAELRDVVDDYLVGRMDERISTLEQRAPGLQGSSKGSS